MLKPVMASLYHSLICTCLKCSIIKMVWVLFFLMRIHQTLEGKIFKGERNIQLKIELFMRDILSLLKKIIPYVVKGEEK